MMKAYDKALSLLAMREHTAKEIKDKLTRKGYSDDDITDAVERLISENAISEERFAESYIRSRMRKNPEGKPVLMMRLRERGCPDSASRNAVESYWENLLFMPYLASSYDVLSSRKGREYATASLMRKGFSISEIRAAAEYSDDE